MLAFIMAAAVTPVSNYMTPHVATSLAQMVFHEPGRVCRNTHELDIQWLGIRLSAARMLPKSAIGFAHPGCILGGNPLRWRVTPLSRSGRGDLRSSAPECSYLPRLRSAATIVIRNLRDLADNPEDFGSCVDAN